MESTLIDSIITESRIIPYAESGPTPENVSVFMSSWLLPLLQLETVTNVTKAKSKVIKINSGKDFCIFIK